MLEIAAGPNTSANNSGKWRQPKSESWPLFGGDSTFFSQQQKEQPRRTEETTSEKRKSNGGGFGDDGVTSGIDVHYGAVVSPTAPLELLLLAKTTSFTV